MFIQKLKFDRKGLIPVIIQDINKGKVLMLAYMNKEALKRTIKLGKTCFWSRSRKKYWVKGEESGNYQIVKEIYFDCDGDTILIKVKQLGKGACHEGYRSCFFRKMIKSGNYKIIEKKVFDPKKVYKRNTE
ncbi:MAG TPA: phosphoribosyl-AMP cyclohydrolase [Elusimicrobia bacterium]|nr:phosphoribosyl-AMP cyclohydrolase [Elusimicrobiota bacterium]